MLIKCIENLKAILFEAPKIKDVLLKLLKVSNNSKTIEVKLFVLQCIYKLDN